jgi:CheY-like chemotaxis protein
MQSGSFIRDSNILASLFPAARRRIFCALFRDPARWWSLPELAGRTGMQPATLQKHLSLLRNGGIVRSATLAGKMMVQTNAASPVFSEMQSIVNKLSAGMPFSFSETILVVEDQAATARITRILLESWGYQVLEALRAREAIAIFERHSAAIRLLLADVNMPEMSGPDLADELIGRNPELRVIFMSGSPSEEVKRREAPFLSKPFNPASLSRIIRRELDRAECGASPKQHRMNALLD